MRWWLVLLCLSVATPVWADASRDFDNVDDEVDAGNVNDVTTGDVTVCAWVNPDEDAEIDAFVSKKNANADSNAGYSLQQTAVDTPRFSASDGTDAATAIGTTDLDGVWSFQCGTFTSSTETSVVYVNGVLENSTAGTNVDSLSNAVSYQAGEHASDLQDADGQISHNFMYTSILTVTEMVDLQWHPGIIAGMATWWTFWADSPEQDLSGNNRDGTVEGSIASAEGPPIFMAGGLPL